MPRGLRRALETANRISPLRLLRGSSADLKLAARRLLATPLFTIFAVLSLALGVGVTTAVYSIVDSIFLLDFGIRDPERVVLVVSPYDGRFSRGSISHPDFQDLRDAQTSLASISASAWVYPAITGPSATEIVAAEAVDGAYFSTLGIGAAIGRLIQPADDNAGAQVVVLSHRPWRGRFAGDPSIVGQAVRISGRPFEVIGVAVASFEGASGGLPGTRLWIPLAAEASLPLVASRPGPVTPPRDRRRLIVFGRLAPSVTVEQASAELTAIAASLDATFPARTQAKPGGQSERPWKAKSIAAITADDIGLRRFGLTLVALVALVLVVACTNLANLVLARGAARQQELTVRCALGAPRWRLVREQCAESLLLAIAGAAGSWVVFQSMRLMLDTEFNLMLPFGGHWTMTLQPTLDPAALGIAAACLLISLVVFGLEPALQLTRSIDLRGELAAGAGGLGNPKTRRQQMLLRWQVAISTGFFIIATMFVKYTIQEARHDSGVDMARLGVAVLNFKTGQWDEERVRGAMDRVLEEARKDPDVDTVSVSAGLPFGLPTTIRLELSTPERMSVNRDDFDRVSALAATPGIFSTMGVPILRGRGFDARDHSGAAPAVVLSAFTARRMFGRSDPVGQQVVLETQPAGARTATVIGVARDTDVRSILGEPRPFAYLPLAQQYESSLAVLARAADAPLAVRAPRNALRRADPDLAIDVIGPGRTVLAGFFVFLRGVGIGTLALGTMTMLLAMVGLFGIQSHSVAHRTREIGLRMSFGARSARIQRMVLMDGYRPVFDGLVIGLFGGLAGRVIVRAYMEVDVNVVDPWMLLVVPIPLILAAFCACYLPARRAAAVDPMVALRHV